MTRITNETLQKPFAGASNQVRSNENRIGLECWGVRGKRLTFLTLAEIRHFRAYFFLTSTLPGKGLIISLLSFRNINEINEVRKYWCKGKTR